MVKITYKKGQPWNKAKTKIMLQFEEEKHKNAIYRGKITGMFEYWLWQQEKKKTKKTPKQSTKKTKQPTKKKQTSKLSITDKGKIKKLERKIEKLEDEYAINPSEQYDISSKIDVLMQEIEKIQPRKKISPKKRVPPPKSKGRPLTKEEKIQDILSRENLDAVGITIELGDIIYFKSGKAGPPYKVIEKKLLRGKQVIQLRNLKTGRLIEKFRPELDYLLVLTDIDKGGKDYNKKISIPEAKTWNTLSQKRRFIFLTGLNYRVEVRNKYLKLTFGQLPHHLQRQIAFQSNGIGDIDQIANLNTKTVNKRVEHIKDRESREKDNYYCTKDKTYHYQGRGAIYKEHKKFAKKGSKKPLYKVHIGSINMKDVDKRLQKLIWEYRSGINYYDVTSTIRQDMTAPKKYNPSYLVHFKVKSEKGNWKNYGQMGWQWVPEEHKFMEY